MCSSSGLQRDIAMRAALGPVLQAQKGLFPTTLVAFGYFVTKYIGKLHNALASSG